MDTVTILRELWRLRLAVFGVGLVALLAGTAVVYKIPSFESRQHEVGLATMRILVDTPSSQIIEVAPKGSDSLGVRANLLASLMVDGDVKQVIAKRAGLPPEKLVGITEAAAEPAPASDPPGPDSYVLTTRVLTNAGGDQLPLIEMEAQAPDRVAAARLGAAAVAGLGDYLDSTAALQEVKDANRLKVSGMGAPQARTALRGPSKMIAIVVTLFLFALGCAGVLGFFAVAYAWRDASAGEEPPDWHVDDELGGGAADDWLPPAPALVTQPADDDWVAGDELWAKRA
jgi:hypothetical protein